MNIRKLIRVGLPVGLGIATVCVLGFVARLGFRAAADVSKDHLSRGRFAQIELLLMNYHRDHGTFPPTKYQASPNGPIHSWRILLMPYCDVNSAVWYAELDLSEPLDSPTNARASQGLKRFGSIFSMDHSTTAHYLAIGPDDAWPSEKPLTARVITKEADQFLLVEYPDSDVFWMEPEY